MTNNTKDMIPVWKENMKANQEALAKLPVIKKVYFPVGDVVIVGAGPTLVGAYRRLLRYKHIIANQSSAPYLMYKGITPEHIVIVDPSEAVLKRLEYPLAHELGGVTFWVSSMVHPKVLEKLLKTSADIAWFASFHQEIPDKEDYCIPDNKDPFFVQQVGNVINASVLLAQEVFPQSPIAFCGVDFGYPKEFRPLMRVPSVVKERDKWRLINESEPGPYRRLFGYETSYAHLTYYDQLGIIRANSSGREWYTLTKGPMEDYCPYRKEK